MDFPLIPFPSLPLPFLAPCLACRTGEAEGTAGLDPHLMGTHREGLHHSLRAHKTDFRLQDHLSNRHSRGRNHLRETTLIQMVIPRATYWSKFTVELLVKPIHYSPTHSFSLLPFLLASQERVRIP